MNRVLCFVVFVTVCPLLVLGQGLPQVDSICTGSRHHELCEQLDRGDSQVSCKWVQDPIECAERLLNNTATLGVFTAENIIHLASLGWEDFIVVRELRHPSRVTSFYDYDSVVIVKKTFQNGLSTLKGLNFCHPGLYYDKTQRWSERMLKHFERTVIIPDCKIDGNSPAEIEASAMSRFFKSACRPGLWSNDPFEDSRLKLRYSNLCSLCGTNSCTYPTSANISNSDHHQLALECLKNQKGDVAYVSGDDGKKFMSNNSDHYQYLCPDGTLSNTSCPWMKQPWGAIVTNRNRSIEMDSKIKNWMTPNTGDAWRQTVAEIIIPDDLVEIKKTIQRPADYIRPTLTLPIAFDLCSTTSSWCTVNEEEYNKCEILRHAGITSGIYPLIECKHSVPNDITCLNEIKSFRADFTGIDSNFGYLARHPYNLTGALYAETEKKHYSSLVVVVKAKSTYTSFESLRQSNGCFPEYGGIASIAFVNMGKSRGFLDKDDCHFSRLLNDFFNQGCFPGARDKLHDPRGKHDESLCGLCKTNFAPLSSPIDELEVSGDIDFAHEVNERGEIIPPHSNAKLQASCNADPTNRFYGNRGALLCLAESGDVAVLELQYLNDHAKALGINPDEYKILCRNGSLASYNGFNVDQACALTTIVDGEIVVRRNDVKTPGIVNALLSFDKYLQRDPQFKMYNIFKSERNILFKDSTIGLVSPHATNLGSAVKNYIQLFQNIETCVEEKSTTPADTICTGNRHQKLCEQLKPGDSEVVCQWVQDPIECAQRLSNHTATLGVFTAENIIHLASLGWDDFVVVRELRHQSRIRSFYDYDSVVIVKKTFQNGLSTLKGLNFCHPGIYYDKTQRWSERMLKHFERTVIIPDCKIDGNSPAEIEASAMSRFFKSACRPGLWSNDLFEDSRLKLRYPNLCSLCGTKSCTYPTSTNIPNSDHHQLALECLKTQDGDVAYVSGDHGKSFMSDNSDHYQYLCPDGTLSNISCPWMKQPWGAIVTNSNRSMDIDSKIKYWMESDSNDSWRQTIIEIFSPDDLLVAVKKTVQKPQDYLHSIMTLPVAFDLCSTSSSWCTVNEEEYSKCEILRHAGITSGIYPLIECKNAVSNEVTCLNEIKSFRADFTGIDSNFGYLARHPYNLTGALYADTEKNHYSSVVVVVKAKSTYSSFESLRQSNGCFPEYGGIASIAFVNMGKSLGFLNKDDCHFSKLLNDFFKQGCFPGARDNLHDSNGKHDDFLCSLCKTNLTPLAGPIEVTDGIEVQHADEENERDEVIIPHTNKHLQASCNAAPTNRFYGNRGALLCLAESGDVAVLELQYLNDHAKVLGINPDEYKILCRNGSLASYNGFNVDQACALITIVDGEIVVRRNDVKTPGIVNALLSFDKYLQKDPQFKIYNIFKSERNILFKDSTIGLISPHAKNVGFAVKNYIELFQSIESCVEEKSTSPDAGVLISINIYVISIAFLFAFIRNYRI